MASLSRWSRESARRRWVELGDLVERPLTVGVVALSMWPACSLVLNLSSYRSPPAAAAVLVVAVAIPLVLCRVARRGIGLFVSLATIAASTTLSVVLGLLIVGDTDETHFMNSWSAAGVVVLVFARPVEEPLLGLVGALAANVAVTGLDPADLQAWHIAPTTIGAPVPMTVCAIALAGFLRSSVRTSRRMRAALELAEHQRALADAVQDGRDQRYARWDRTVTPLLDRIAAGLDDPEDPEVRAECARLASALRAQLAGGSPSPFSVLLEPERTALQARGGDLRVHDIGVGDALDEYDRVRLTEMVRELSTETGIVSLSLVGTPDEDRALVVIGGDGVPAPLGGAWATGTTTQDSPTRWWWDAEVHRHRSPGRQPPSR